MIELQRKKRRLSKQAVESCFPRSRRHDNLLLISERKHDIASQDGDRNNEYWIRLFILVMNQRGGSLTHQFCTSRSEDSLNYPDILGHRVFSSTKRKGCSPAQNIFYYS